MRVFSRDGGADFRRGGRTLTEDEAVTRLKMSALGLVAVLALPGCVVRPAPVAVVEPAPVVATPAVVAPAPVAVVRPVPVRRRVVVVR